MVWHRDKEDDLVLVCWEYVDTFVSKVQTQNESGGKEPQKSSINWRCATSTFFLVGTWEPRVWRCCAER